MMLREASVGHDRHAASPDIEMDPDVLLAFDRMSVLHGGKEAPVPQCLQQQLVQSRVLGGSDERDLDRAVRMNGEAGQGHGLIGILAQIIRQHR